MENIIEIRGEIDDPVKEYVFERLKEIISSAEKVIAISIDSKGGFIEIAKDIYDLLKSVKSEGIEIITYNEGDVISAATLIYLAGDVRIWNPDKGEFLIHKPTIENISGNSEELLTAGIILEQYEQSLVNFYKGFSDKPFEEILDRMSKEIPMTVDELIEYGFVTEI